MNPQSTRVFTVSRIVALALIATVVAGLGYLRFGTGSDPVSVPEGAKAGDVILERSTYATEEGTYAADRGTLVVPENRADPKSRLIALPIVRIHAKSDRPAEPIFRLQGGPGKTNMQFKIASRFADDHDVVLVGYRGVDGSVRLDCPEVESALKHSTDILGDKTSGAYGDAFRECAARLTDEGVDLRGYDIVQRVDDLEAARKALGYDRVDLLSESVGTRYAMVYAWRYPTSIHRSVMVAVNPPGHFIWDAKTTDEQIRRYSDVCSTDDTCSKSTDDLAAAIKRVNEDMPGRWGFLRIKEGNVRAATFFGLMESSEEGAGPLSAPMTLKAWISADEGDASGFWLQSLLADMAFPTSFVWGELAAIGAADDDVAKRYYSTPRGDTILGSPGTDLIWGIGTLVDAWPGSNVDQYDRVRTSNVETLLIGGEVDVTTPPQVATKELLPYLPNGKEIVIPRLGHSTSFWTEQPEAGTRLINTYLASGRVDDSLYTPMSVDFTPEVTHTALAKGFAGTMIGLALLTVLSLLVMAVRVHRRGRIGRKSGALLRSVYAVVLGLGGWFLGVLIVISTMRSVPLDSAVLAVLSIGLPVGLGIYFAWVNRDSRAGSKAVGLAAALAGALVGVRLGSDAAAGLLAVLTAILGAVAGSNLSLILLDMSRARFAAESAALVVDSGTFRPVAPTPE
jgi:pimeloyl-ACP methyl ester carboxylesterase